MGLTNINRLLSEVLHEYLCISTLTEFSDTLLANLAYTLAGQAQLITNLFKSLFMSVDSKTLFNDLYLTALKDFRQYTMQLKSH